MQAKEPSRLVAALAAVPDPRRQCKNLRHPLVDVLVVGFCGVLCGCEDFVELETFGRKKADFFRRFLELPEGIPSHDTFRRVLQAVCPQALQRCLVQWLKDVRQAAQPEAEGEVIAIDGKTLRRTFDRARGLGALHLVSAWATVNGLTLGQVAVDAKSNEITAIPQLIELLDLKGCVVTIDAAGCQKEIAAQIVAKEADYVLALKENQPTLYEQVSDHFLEQLEKEGPERKLRHHREVEEGHGRSETRDTFVAPATKELVASGAWLRLATVVLVIRRCVEHATGKSSDEVRYSISSLPAKVKRLARAVRQHWGIENGLHWVLDVAFNEDRMRQRDRTGIENLALLNRLVAVPALARRLAAALPPLEMAVGLAGVALLWIVLSVEAGTYFAALADRDFVAAATARAPQQQELYDHAEHLQRTGLAAVSVVWAAYAAVLLAAGFRLRTRPLRWAALGLFGLTLGKVVLFDTAHLRELYRAAVFLVLALMMAAGAWGYQKVARRAALERR